MLKVNCFIYFNIFFYFKASSWEFKQDFINQFRYSYSRTAENVKFD